MDTDGSSGLVMVGMRSERRGRTSAQREKTTEEKKAMKSRCRELWVPQWGEGFVLGRDHVGGS